MGYENRGKVRKDELYELYITQNKTLEQIGYFYKITPQAIGRYIKKFGFVKNVSGRKRYWRDKINKDNEDFIYLMGFLYADGCIQKNGNSYSLHLSIAEKDKEHLILLSKILADDIKIRYRKIDNIQDQYSFQINGMDIFDIVSKYGIIPNKSHNWIEPDVPIHLLPSFLRGWFDGDGCVYVRNNRYLALSIVGNKKSLEFYVKSLKNIGYNGHMTWYNDIKGFSCIHIRNIDDCLSFYNIINGNFRLERKWLKIENVLKIRNKK